MLVEQGWKAVNKLWEGRTKKSEPASLTQLTKNIYAVTKRKIRDGNDEDLTYNHKDENGNIVKILVTRETVQTWKASIIDRLIDTENPADLWNNLKRLYNFARQMRKLHEHLDGRLHTANDWEMRNWPAPEEEKH